MSIKMITPKGSSSTIGKVGYIENELTMIVDFKKNNLKYEYYNVPKSIYLGFIQSDAPGKYFLNFIKGKYEFEKQ